ncbi:sensor histidine kinase [Streptomyces sp. TE33382]
MKPDLLEPPRTAAMARDTPSGTKSAAGGGPSPALAALRGDLFRHAFAVRPLPPLSDSPALIRARSALPAALRDATRWAPHLAVVALALLAAVASFRVSGFAHGLPVLLLTGAPVLLTLVMPVGAWWLTMLAILVGSADLAGLGGMGLSLLLLTCPLVLVVASMRLGSWAAFWMWLITGAFVLGGGGVLGIGTPLSFQVLALALAGFVAVLMGGWQRAGKRAAEQTSAAEDERNRRAGLEERTAIARELHDVVAHHMSVVAIQAEAAQYRVENPPPELTETFATLRENAVLALAEMRRILGVIRADTEPGTGPGNRAPQPTLARLGPVIAGVRASGAEVTKTVTGKVRVLAPGVELSAYRIVQEALSNVLRHAPGAAVAVELSYVTTGLGLRVVNGPAQRPASDSPGAGHGLIGMRERITMLEGRLTTRPTAEGGFEVTAFLPDATQTREEDAEHA